jgi:hypothetical protein
MALPVSMYLDEEEVHQVLSGPFVRLCSLTSGNTLFIGGLETGSGSVWTPLDVTEMTSDFLCLLNEGFVGPFNPSIEGSEFMGFGNYLLFKEGSDVPLRDWSEVEWLPEREPVSLKILFTSAASRDRTQFSEIFAAYAEANGFCRTWRGHTAAFVHKDNIPPSWKCRETGFWMP